MSRYSSIAAVGQQNDMACWAACLKWWYKAELAINASQNALWERYKGLEGPAGGMTDSGIQHIIGENGMKSLPFLKVSDFNADRVADLLKAGPIYIAYTRTGEKKKHVNVIYKLVGSGPWASVMVMEPQFSEKADGTFKGMHESRSLSDYNIQGTIYAGVNRKRWDAWVNS